MTLIDLLPQVIAIAELAAEKIITFYEGCEVSIKADNSPVTAADLASQALIVEALSKISHLPVIAEEEGRQLLSDALPPDFWLVDPLDGTKDFIAHNGEFAVNIGLIQGGEPVLGVIAGPAKRVVWGAIQGGGVVRKRFDESTTEPVIRLATLPTKGVASRFHLSTEVSTLLERIGTGDVLRLGSALKFCWLAEGAADVYVRYGRTCEWDTAAGHCIAREAGCEIVDLERGEPLRYRKPNFLNPGFIAAPRDVVYDYWLASQQGIS